MREVAACIDAIREGKEALNARESEISRHYDLQVSALRKHFGELVV
jgi:hypothetical protein